MRWRGVLDARPSRWFFVTAGCLFISVTIFGLWVAFDLGGSWTTDVVDNVGQLIAPLIATAACIWAARRSRIARLAWSFLGASSLSWALGQAVWCYYALIRGVPVPFPSLADAGYLGAVPFAIVGLLAFPSELRRVTSRLRALLDGLLISGSLLFLSWATVLGPIYRSHQGGILKQVLSMSYPASDVVLVSLVVVLATHTSRNYRWNLCMVMGGMVAFAVSDSSFAYFTEVNNYGIGSVLDTGWVAGYLLIALGALWPEHPTALESSDAERVTLASVLAPYGLAAAAGVAAAVRIAERRRFGLFLALEGFILIVILAGRQIITLLDNLTLNRRLHSKVELGTRELRDREARYSALVEHSSDAITIVAEDATILYQSPSVTKVLGWDADRSGGASLLDLLHPEDRSRWRALVGRLKADPRDEVTTEWRIQHSDGSWRTFQSVVTNMLDEPGVGGLVLNSRDVTDQRAVEDQLRHQAFHDPLTGLANRALFAEHLERAVRRRTRYGGSVHVMFIDLDDFKAVNDLRGRAKGDKLLRQAADRLQTTLREADAIARLGGDEFAVLFEGTLGGIDPGAAANRLAEAFAIPFELDDESVMVTASMGVATDEGGADTEEELLRHADLAVYAAKAKGKRCCVVYTSELHDSILEAMRIETELRQAVERGEFLLFYQPIVDLASGRITGIEGLIRWEHPDRGLVFPNDFIGVAESSGWIVPMGEWVLTQACRDLKTLDDVGGKPMRVSVNVSPRQLSDPGFVTMVINVLEVTHLRAERLTLEVTESLYVDDVAGRTEALRELRKLGVKIAIDDFGTGYSSLGSLREMPVDVLKIDKSFVDNIADSAESVHLVRMILELAHNLGVATVAEGAEEADQVQILRAMGCQSVQGYYFSKPVPLQAIEALVQHDFALPPALTTPMEPLPIPG